MLIGGKEERGFILTTSLRGIMKGGKVGGFQHPSDQHQSRQRRVNQVPREEKKGGEKRKGLQLFLRFLKCQERKRYRHQGKRRGVLQSLAIQGWKKGKENRRSLPSLDAIGSAKRKKKRSHSTACHRRLISAIAKGKKKARWSIVVPM